MGNIFRLRAPIAPEDDEAEALAKALGYAIGPPGIIMPYHTKWWSCEHRNAPKQFRIGRDGKKVWFSLEGQRRQRIGVIPGMSDTWVMWWWRFYVVELKREEGGVASKDQLRFIEDLRACGHEGAVCEGWVAAMRWLYSLGIPMRAMKL